MKVKVLSILVLILALCMKTQTTMAQRREKVFSTEGWWKPAEPPFSPVVNDDHSITFRVKAPNAKNVLLILENFCLCLIQRTLGELPNFGVMIWQLYYMLRSALICFQVTRFRNKGNHFI